MVKPQAPMQTTKINFELRSLGDPEVALRNAENTLNSNTTNDIKNGNELSRSISSGGFEDELERLVRDVAELSPPIQPDKQRWLREKQDLIRARDLSLPSSPVSPQTLPGGSPPRHEIFRSSPPAIAAVPVSSAGHLLTEGSCGAPPAVN
ncbi:SH2 domain-containing protein 4A-like, partial [Tropilaelaps mercedesae]